MKFFVQQKPFLEALRSVARFVNPRCGHPVAGHCLFRADASGRVTVSAADTDCWVTLPLEAAVRNPGEYMAPLRLLIELGRTLSGPLTVSGFDGNSLGIEAGGDVFRIASLPGSEYFKEPAIEAKGSAKISLPLFRQMLKVVIPSAALHDQWGRAVMQGVQVSFGPEGLGLVATNGGVLARIATAKGSQKKAGEVVVPASILKALTLVKRDDVCRVAIGKDQVSFDGAQGFRLASRLIGGKYPNHEAVIPKEEAYLTKAIFQKGAMVQAVRRALVCAQEMRSQGLIRWNFEEGAPIGYEAKTSDSYSGTGTVAAEVSGSPLVVGFNGNYLLSALNVIKEDTVEWCLQTDQKSATLRPSPSSDFAAHEHIIMPVKLRDIAEEYERKAFGEVA